MSKELADYIKNIRRLTTRLEFACMTDGDPQGAYEASAIVAGIIGDAETILGLLQGTQGK